jgi:dihydroorotate dehydrogenase
MKKTWWYEQCLRPLAFLSDPEWIHHRVESTMGQVGAWPLRQWLRRAQAHAPSFEGCSFLGMPVAHPIGLAAGFDKNGTFLPYLDLFGFSHVELGTVTAQPQPGNPKPRLFRLLADEAILNRMGFNNEGVEALVPRLAAAPDSLIVGGNIGKTKVVPLGDEAIADYAFSFSRLKDHVDYMVVNVSSPNTPHLRQLQDREPLLALLSHLQSLNDKQKPLLLKIAPDLSDTQLQDIADIVDQTNLSGLIATNTTVARDGLTTAMAKVKRYGEGGISGRPLAKISTTLVRQLRKAMGPDRFLIGVGGIFTGEDVLEKLCAGANAVQIYTSFVYRGPLVVYALLAELKEAMSRNGWTQWADIRWQ